MRIYNNRKFDFGTGTKSAAISDVRPDAHVRAGSKLINDSDNV